MILDPILSLHTSIKPSVTTLTCRLQKNFSLCMLWKRAEHVWRKSIKSLSHIINGK